MNVICIVGARPNFMKIAPVLRALRKHSGMNGVLVHTGQHYNADMSDVFFRELGIPEPEINLEVGSHSHGGQTGRIMIEFDEVLPGLRADVVVVVGDVNSTIACALVAVKRGIPVAHVEAGLRSFDRSMPEEINRVLTDQISDSLFTTEQSARSNLVREGIAEERIHFVGNTMIDTLVAMMPKIDSCSLPDDLGLRGAKYGVVTFHRPSNVDNPEQLERFVQFIEDTSKSLPLVFAAHPRTRKQLEKTALWKRLGACPELRVLGPQPYSDFLALVKSASVVITDSGGLQEETTYLGVPCLTQRTSTERPITVEVGTNQLIGQDFAQTSKLIGEVLQGNGRAAQIPPLWDGRCAERIVEILQSKYG